MSTRQHPRKALNRRDFIKAPGWLVGAGAFALKRSGASPDSNPNVLFIMADQQRFPYMSAYGGASVKTPAMDSISREGVLFTRAFCSTPQCSASRSSIMTGLYPHVTGVIGNTEAAGGNPLGPRTPSLGKIFWEAGYRTGYFGKWHLGGDARNHGWDAYDECGRGVGVRVVEGSVQFLGESKEPFLLFCSLVNPHDIYGFQTLRKTIGRSKEGIKLPGNLRDDLSKKPRPQIEYRDEDQGKAAAGLTEEGWIDYLNVYSYLIEKVDGEIGEVLAELRQGGREKRTVIVFTSDHGDLGGAHGLAFKGPMMYEELLRIPLAVAFPESISRGRRVEELVVNVDLLPTICELAGLPAPKQIHGRSLVPLLEGKGVSWRDYVIGEYYSKQRWVNPLRMVRTKDWKYTRYRKWGEELYDLRDDPGELKSLAGSEAYAAVKGKLSGILDNWMRETDDPFESLSPTDRAGRPVQE